MPEDDYTAVAEAVRSAFGVPLVTKFVIVAEVIDSDGDKCLQYLRSEDLAVWDSLGLLNAQLLIEKAQLRDVSQED